MAHANASQHDQDCAEQRKSWSHGTFFWNELMTRDVERAKRFYGDTIRWRFDPMKMADGRTYWCAMEDGRPVAGLFPLDASEFDGVPEGWISYLAVDDVDTSASQPRSRPGAS